MFHTVRILGLFALLAALCLTTAPAESCAPAFRTGSMVRIAEENALIIWDASSKTEHFIRRGTFQTDSPDFGFLVPTPTEPNLAEAEDAIFSLLDEWTRPEIVYRRIKLPPGAKYAIVGAAPAPMEAVQVLGEQRVAGLDAVKLKASDTKALLEWLKKHGYSSRPALESWLDRYVQDGWVITAFKIARDKTGQKKVSTRALRLSFKTDQPFYPYREPEDMRSPGEHPLRFLRVFVLSNERMTGQFGPGGATTWHGDTVWANPLETPRRDELLRRLKLEKGGLGDQPWLTVFEDSVSPRPGSEEVYFSTSPDQISKKRPPIIREVYDYSSPDEVMSSAWIYGLFAAGGLGLALLVGIVLFFTRR